MDESADEKIDTWKERILQEQYEESIKREKATASLKHCINYLGYDSSAMWSALKPELIKDWQNITPQQDKLAIAMLNQKIENGDVTIQSIVDHMILATRPPAKKSL